MNPSEFFSAYDPESVWITTHHRPHWTPNEACDKLQSMPPIQTSLFATLRIPYCIKTAEDVKHFSQIGSPVILVVEPKHRYTIPSEISSARR